MRKSHEQEIITKGCSAKHTNLILIFTATPVHAFINENVVQSVILIVKLEPILLSNNFTNSPSY